MPALLLSTQRSVPLHIKSKSRSVIWHDRNTLSLHRDISFKSDDSEQCHCLKILSLSYKLPRHSTVCTNRLKGEMDISSASGPHSLHITFELAESRLESTGGGGSVFNCVCLSSPTPPPAALQAQPTTLKWDFTILFHKISKTNTSWLSRFYWMLNMSSSFISEKEKVVTLPESLCWFYFILFRCTIILTWLWRMNASSFLKWFVLAASGAEGQGWINWYIRIIRSHQALRSHSTFSIINLLIYLMRLPGSLIF